MLRALLPRCATFVCTAAPNPRALLAGDAGLARRRSSAAARRSCRTPRAALARARELAGPDGAVVATGSIYLIADLRLGAGRAEGLRAVNDRGPSVLGMIALVAVVVALTILVFFALGYAFGRMFL